jgi:cytochrome c nitrite reductase small subunit
MRLGSKLQFLFMNYWAILVGVIVLVIALGVFSWSASAASYLGHEPSTCNNCHVMDSQYENWEHGAHQQAAVCTDCHLPHQDLIRYYAYKGYSGMKDVLSFTLKSYSPAIRANQQTQTIVQDNCIRCHEDTVESILAGDQPFKRYCWDCHRSAAHGDRGLSLYPYQDSEVYKR